jgi:hypothetical protein
MPRPIAMSLDDRPRLPPDGKIRVHHSRWYAGVAWGAIVLFGSFACFAWRAGQPVASATFAVFIVLGLLMLLTTGWLEVDDGGLVYRNRLGRHRIGWEEIQRVESDGQTMVLCGPDKHLPFAPGALGSEQKAEFMAYVMSRLDARAVPMVESRTASYRLPRNTRV